MALMKEPYGLVYNDDGSLCVTYRDDDIPFPGVRSFAVEAGTTNVSNKDELPEEYIFEGDDGYRYVLTSTSTGGLNPPTNQIGGRFYLTDMSDSTVIHWNVQDGSFEPGSYTISFWHQDGSYYKVNYTDGTFEVIGFTTKSQWTRHYYTTPPDKTVKGIGFGGSGSAKIRWDDFQVEKQMFPTSYTPTTRPDGRLVVSSSRLETNAYNRLHNHVIAVWVKIPEYYHTIGATSAHATIFGNTPVNNTASPGQYRWSISIHKRSDGVGSHDLRFVQQANISGIPFTTKIDTIKAYGEYEFDTWFFLVCCIEEVGNDRNIKVYYNGEKEVETVTQGITNWLPENEDIILHTSVPFSKLISNLYIGKYRRPDGTVIWTDDYIREVYESQIPFPVSNKLSIY